MFPGILKPPITKPKPPANKPKPAPRTSLSQSDDQGKSYFNTDLFPSENKYSS